MIAALSTRPALRRLMRGLIAYGIVGLALSAVATIAVILAIGRLTAVGDTVGGGAGQLGAALTGMTAALDEASVSAASFGTTIDNGSAALAASASDLRAIVPQLRDIETQANGINILGSRPLAPIAGLFGQIAGQLGDLDGRLDTVATNLTENRGALKANAASLAALAAETRALAARLTPDVVIRVVDDARLFAIALLVVLLAGVAVPAAAALAFGWWLRRELGESGLISDGSSPAGSSGGGPTPA